MHATKSYTCYEVFCMPCNLLAYADHCSAAVVQRGCVCSCHDAQQRRLFLTFLFLIACMMTCLKQTVASGNVEMCVYVLHIYADMCIYKRKTHLYMEFVYVYTTCTKYVVYVYTYTEYVVCSM